MNKNENEKLKDGDKVKVEGTVSVEEGGEFDVEKIDEEENLRQKLSELEKKKSEIEKELGLYKTTKEDYLDRVQEIFELDDTDFSNKASYQGGGKSAIRKSGLRKMVEQLEES